jgi:hypothetical protein
MRSRRAVSTASWRGTGWRVTAGHSARDFDTPQGHDGIWPHARAMTASQLLVRIERPPQRRHQTLRLFVRMVTLISSRSPTVQNGTTGRRAVRLASDAQARLAESRSSMWWPARLVDQQEPVRTRAPSQATNTFVGATIRQRCRNLTTASSGRSRQMGVSDDAGVSWYA